MINENKTGEGDDDDSDDYDDSGDIEDLILMGRRITLLTVLMTKKRQQINLASGQIILIDGIGKSSDILSSIYEWGVRRGWGGETKRQNCWSKPCHMSWPRFWLHYPNYTEFIQEERDCVNLVKPKIQKHDAGRTIDLMI